MKYTRKNRRWREAQATGTWERPPRRCFLWREGSRVDAVSRRRDALLLCFLVFAAASIADSIIAARVAGTPSLVPFLSAARDE